MGKTLHYNGPPDMAIAGVIGELKPGAEVEVDDDAYKSLKDHPWFTTASSQSATKRERKRKRSSRKKTTAAAPPAAPAPAPAEPPVEATPPETEEAAT